MNKLRECRRMTLVAEMLEIMKTHAGRSYTKEAFARLEAIQTELREIEPIDTARALRETLSSPDADPTLNAANVADGLYAIASALDRIASVFEKEAAREQHEDNGRGR